MMRLTPMLICALLGGLAGCGGDDAQPVETKRLDPEVVARHFFAEQVFLTGAAARPLFVREADPEAFALRGMVAGPGDYRFVDLWRLRTVDGRLVAEALIELKGAAHVFTAWFEMQEGAWRVAGWNPGTMPVDPSAPVPPAGARVPIPFAPAAFKGAAPRSIVQVEPPWAEIEILDRDLPVEALPRVLEADAACPQAALSKSLDAAAARFAECYVDAIDEGPVRRGRMTFDVVTTATPAKVDATLAETTLIHPALGQCVERALRRIEPPGACTARILVTYAPKGEKPRRGRRRR
ncbi:MAG: hypothetical protein KC620_20135 [Myxococcales bacterium]|nr:hypothetical protein [Myxococcales bacterium]